MNATTTMPIAPAIDWRSAPDLQNITVERWEDGRWRIVSSVAIVNPATGELSTNRLLEVDPWQELVPETGRYRVWWGGLKDDDPGEPHHLWLAWAQSQAQAGAIYNRTENWVATP